MSLCLFVRDSNNNVIMTSDSAITVFSKDGEFRAANIEDYDKTFFHNGYLIFCSGAYPECTKVRAYIRSKENFDIREVQQFARQVCTEPQKRQLALFIVYPNGIVQALLSVHNFKIDEAPYLINQALHTAVGEQMNEANRLMKNYQDIGIKTENDLINIYLNLANEKIGNSIVIHKRNNHGLYTRKVIKLKESETINKRTIVFDKDIPIIKSKLDSFMCGNINFSSASSINWGNNSPVQYEFSIDGSTNWHSTMTSSDKYRRDSLDGGLTYGSPYQFKGIDGQDGTDGSDANVPDWVSSMQVTYIDNQWVISPNIYGGKITSGTTIDIGTNATIGKNLYLKDPSGTTDTYKGIWFNGDELNSPGIFSYNDHFLTATAQYLHLIGDGLSDSEITMTTPKLDLTNVNTITWGNNAPVAVFG